MLPTRSIFQLKDTGRLKVKEREKFYYANIHRKKVAGSMLISDIVDFLANSSPSKRHKLRRRNKVETTEQSLFFSNLCRSNLFIFFEV